MAILSATNLSRSFGAVDLFAGVGGSLPRDARVGLVGPNGAGKTTLLRILAGLDAPDSGSVELAGDARIGYLRQEAVRAFARVEGTVREEMLRVFEDLRADQARLAAWEAEMAAGEADEETVARYGELQERFELAGGYDYELRMGRVLEGLGLGEDTWDRELRLLSGGQKTRALLARLLLESPDLLILDEPTNHLDVEAIEWLEGFLGQWEGALLAVSHDRYFLDRACTAIWELRAGGLETFRGNYSAYLQQRDERWSLRAKRHAEVIERLERELDYVRKHIASQNTAQAKGKLQRVSREVEAIRAGGIEVVDRIGSVGWMQATAPLDMERPSDRVNEVARRLSEIRAPDGTPPRPSFRLTPGPRGGDIVLRTKGLDVGFPDASLFRAEDFELRRGERAALIGPNGSGKTTFLRTILGTQKPRAGRVEMGRGELRVGYFDQAHETLDPDRSVLEELVAQSGLREGEARSLLGRFLFSGEEVFKEVRQLSGGERGRLALAILSLQGANLLVMDEPTNHLDIPAQEVLQAVLEAFEGTVLLVTHDRYLVDRLATQIWWLEDGRLRVFDRPYQAFLAARRGADEAAREEARAERESAREEREAARREARGEGLSKNELRRRAEQAAALEREIVGVEAELERAVESLQEASERGDFADIRDATAEHERLQDRLEALYADWGALAE